jgi:MYXO-CTERM domain-containing protein
MRVATPGERMNKLLGSSGTFGLLGAIATVAAALGWSAPARADGGIPRGYGILFEPGNPSHIVVHSQYWGLFNGMDGSSTWTMLCSQVYGGRALDPDNYATVMAKGGRILVAGQFGGLTVSDDTCNWKQINAFGTGSMMESVQGIAPMDAMGMNFAVVTVLGTADGVTSKVYTSTDRGDTWTAVKGTIPKDTSMANLAVAPSDPKRMYVVGVVINGGPRQIAISKDGGDTFDVQPVGAMTDYDPTLIKPLSVVGILPNDPDTLFVRADGGDMQGAMAADELWVSSDAGKTWKLVYTPMDPNDLPGFALTPDGKSVLISGPSEGIKQAALADAIAGKPTLTQIYKGQVWGLNYQGDKLYAGNDDYSMKPSFTVGVSTDNGMTFSKVMTKCEVTFPTCDASSTMTMLCMEQWTRQGGYVTDYLQNACGIGVGGMGGMSGGGGVSPAGGASSTGGTGLPPTTGGTSGTGSTPTGAGGAASGGRGTSTAGEAGSAGNTSSKSSSGCSCSSANASGSSLWLAAAAAFGVGAVRRRRGVKKD